MIPRTLATITMLGLGVMIAGCKSDGQPKATTDSRAVQAAVAANTLIPQGYPPVPDLPVPIGFKIVESISQGYETAGGGRQIDHTYQGRADKFTVERFYETQMPIKGWTLRIKRMEGGEHLLVFDKTRESAEVRIDTVVTLVGERTNVNIKVREH